MRYGFLFLQELIIYLLEVGYTERLPIQVVTGPIEVTPEMMSFQYDTHAQSL
jgi:hypothetical protein